MSICARIRASAPSCAPTRAAMRRTCARRISLHIPGRIAILLKSAFLASSATAASGLHSTCIGMFSRATRRVPPVAPSLRSWATRRLLVSINAACLSVTSSLPSASIFVNISAKCMRAMMGVCTNVRHPAVTGAFPACRNSSSIPALMTTSGTHVPCGTTSHPQTARACSLTTLRVLGHSLHGRSCSTICVRCIRRSARYAAAYLRVAIICGSMHVSITRAPLALSVSGMDVVSHLAHATH